MLIDGILVPFLNVYYLDVLIESERYVRTEEYAERECYGKREMEGVHIPF